MMVPLRYCDHGFGELAAAVGHLLARGVADLRPRNGGWPADAVAVSLRSARAGIAAVLRHCAGEAPRVVVPGFCCRAVAEAVLAAGKHPRFVDIGEDLNLDASEVTSALDADVSAVVVPHMFGRPADIEAVEAACGQRGVLVIDDAAAAMGIRRGGRLLGTFGDAGVFSFAQQKSLTAGQGGLLLANSARVKQAMGRLSLAEPGRAGPACEALWWLWQYRCPHVLPGLRYYLARAKRAVLGEHNGRALQLEWMPGVYAAVARRQMERMEEILERRRRNCRAIAERLAGTAGLSMPQYSPGCPLTRLFVRTPGLRWDFGQGAVCRVHPLARHLAGLGIETARPYVPLHFQKDFAPFADRRLPRTEAIVPELVALPVQGEMSARQFDAIERGVRGFFGG